MTPRGVLTGLALALALTGCGAHGTSAKSTARPTGVGPAMLRLAQCMRAHGHPAFPDPVQQSDGSWNFPDTGDNSKLPPACTSFKRALGAIGVAPSHPSSAQIAQLRRFAACARTSGIPDFPDPGPDGVFTPPPRLQAMNKEALRPLLNPCRQYAPDGLRFSAPTTGGH